MALYILTFWLIFRKLRHSYPRLEKRNFLMITITAFGGLGAAVIQTVFEVIGRSFQPCILFLLTQYSIPVTQSLTSYVMAMSLIAKLLEQRKFREELVKPSRELSTRLDDDENNAYEFSPNENERDQSVKWFQNLNMRVSGYSLSETVVNSCLRPKNSPASTTVEDIQIYNDSNTKLSPQLRTIQAAQIKKRHLVELGCFLVGSSFFVVAYILRISLDPWYQDHDCTGCLYSLPDILFLELGAIIYLTMNYIALKGIGNPDDPLGLVHEFKLVLFAPVILSSTFTLLTYLDPGELMKRQEVNWYLFDWLNMTFIFSIRVPYQIYRAITLEKKKDRVESTEIALLDMLTSYSGKIGKLFRTTQ